MKILIITKSATTLKEGFESRTSILAQEFVKHNHNVCIITSNSNHGASYKNRTDKIHEYIHNGVNLKIINTLQYVNSISFKRILSWIDFEIKIFINLKKLIINLPDVVIISSLSLLTVINGLVIKVKYPKTKLIFEVRDIWPLTLTEEGGYSKYHPAVLFLGLIEKIGYKYYDVVVGTMPNLKEHVETILNKKVDNVHCIPFGVYPNTYDLSDISTINDKTFIKFKNNTKKKFTIGYAGSIGLSNGLNTIIQVIKEMEEYQDIHFVFLGDGGYRDRYQEELSDFKNVTFTGRIKREYVKYYLEKCDVLFIAALPSKVWLYGWSLNKMIDYMISGKPVIAEYDGHRSMINEAESGFFVKSRDFEALKNKIIELYEMPSIDLEKIGKKGKDWIINNRSWEKIANNYLTIIKNI